MIIYATRSYTLKSFQKRLLRIFRVRGLRFFFFEEEIMLVLVYIPYAIPYGDKNDKNDHTRTRISPVNC